MASKKSSESLDELEARVRKKLNDCRIDQSHVFAFVNILNETERRNLFEQLDNLGELNTLVDIVLPPSTSTTSPIISSATATTATTPMTGATTISSKFVVFDDVNFVEKLYPKRQGPFGRCGRSGRRVQRG